jgi:ribosomal protein S27E
MGQRYDMGKCVDCGERRRVYHREWIRASSPRCLGCGGRVEPSDRAGKEHVKHNDESRLRIKED